VTTKQDKSKQQTTLVELNPASGVDVLGDPAILQGRSVEEFTPAEADELLALKNEHGTPICRISRGVSA
jgi:hypothetical protein